MSNPKIKLVNMIMIENPITQEVLALDKIHPDWGGITFPGGKLMPGESIIDSVIREAKEETGLDIQNVRPCGIVHWAAPSGERYMEFLFSTDQYSGQITEGTHEGTVFWISRDKLQKHPQLSLNFEHYLPVFFGNKYTELFFSWDGISWTGTPNYK